jgi:hypothetical protein
MDKKSPVFAKIPSPLLSTELNAKNKILSVSILTERERERERERDRERESKNRAKWHKTGEEIKEMYQARDIHLYALCPFLIRPLPVYYQNPENTASPPQES